MRGGSWRATRVAGRFDSDEWRSQRGWPCCWLCLRASACLWHGQVRWPRHCAIFMGWLFAATDQSNAMRQSLAAFPLVIGTCSVAKVVLDSFDRSNIGAVWCGGMVAEGEGEGAERKGDGERRREEGSRRREGSTGEGAEGERWGVRWGEGTVVARECELRVGSVVG